MKWECKSSCLVVLCSDHAFILIPVWYSWNRRNSSGARIIFFCMNCYFPNSYEGKDHTKCLYFSCNTILLASVGGGEWKEKYPVDIWCTSMVAVTTWTHRWCFSDILNILLDFLMHRGKACKPWKCTKRRAPGGNPVKHSESCKV